MVLPTSPPASMSVSQILTEFGIPAATTKRISNDLFPLVGGTAGTTCLLGASFSGRSAVKVGYSTINGNNVDTGYGIAVDSSGNIYITGTYRSTITVPIRTLGTAPTASGLNLPVSGFGDVFVIKWLADGTVAGYSTFSGNSTDIGLGIAVDSSQNIYITGQYLSSTTITLRTFGTAPTSTGVSMPSSTNAAAFVVKWLANGTLAGYSAIRGSSSILGYGIAVDSSQNIYITGYYFSSGTVPINTFGTAPTASGVSLPAPVGIDVFVVKWLANGTVAGYSTIRGSGTDIGYGIAVDSSQNIYITGYYTSGTTVQLNTFGTAPAPSGVIMPSSLSGTQDAFVIKWNGSNGTVAGYATIRGTGNDIGYGIAVDSSQNIYITGQYVSSGTVAITTFGTAPFASGVSLPASSGAGITDVFVIKWNANGTVAGYSNLSGTSNDIGYGIAVDSSQNIYITGQYLSSGTVTIRTFGTAPTASGVSMPASVGVGGDAFAIKWNAAGTVAGYSTISGSATDIGQGIAVDSSQNIYITGQYSSTTTVTLRTFGTAPVASGFSMPITTNIDAFVIKWNP